MDEDAPVREILRHGRSSPRIQRSLALIADLAATYTSSGVVNRIAVVGNMPLTASAARAERIDDCDLVVRVNGFRADDGRAAVGTRTDVVFFHRGLIPTRWVFDGYRQRLFVLVEPGRLHWEPAYLPPWWPRDLGAVTLPNAETTIPMCAEAGVDVCAEARWPTTGTIAAWSMRRMFPRAHILLSGFSFTDDTRRPDVWEHASGREAALTDEHDLALDAHLMNAMVARGNTELLLNEPAYIASSKEGSL